MHKINLWIAYTFLARLPSCVPGSPVGGFGGVPRAQVHASAAARHRTKLRGYDVSRDHVRPSGTAKSYQMVVTTPPTASSSPSTAFWSL